MLHESRGGNVPAGDLLIHVSEWMGVTSDREPWASHMPNGGVLPDWQEVVRMRSVVALSPGHMGRCARESGRMSESENGYEGRDEVQVEGVVDGE